MNFFIKVALFLCLAGLNASGNVTMASASNPVLAIVNGKEITVNQIKSFSRAGSIDFDNIDPLQKEKLIESSIKHQLLLEKAKNEGFDQTDHMVAAVKVLTESYIVKQFIVQVALSFDISEEVLKNHYKDKYLNLTHQYKVRHILSTTEADSTAIILEINDGTDFSNLAKQKSLDKVSAPKGGDLGWLTQVEMVPSFYITVSELKEGTTSLKPTKTQFGWHAIILDDKREVTPPTFEEVEKSIKQQLIGEKLAEYISDLKDIASIVIK